MAFAGPGLYEAPNCFHTASSIDGLHLNERRGRSVIVRNPLCRRHKLIISLRRGGKTAAGAEGGASVTSIVSVAL